MYPQDSNTLKGKRILIADDMDFNRYVCAAVFSGMGAEIDQAEDGLIALNLLRSAPYDIAILDISMPKMTGPEVVECYLKENHQSAPEFIALSAYNHPKMKIEYRAVGFNYCLEKPLDPQKLKKILKHHQSPTTNDTETGLIEYLSSIGTKSLNALKTEYRHSLNEVIKHLRVVLIKEDIPEQAAVIHKLAGLCWIQQSETINELMEMISIESKQDAPKEVISLLIDQLSMQIDKELSS